MYLAQEDTPVMTRCTHANPSTPPAAVLGAYKNSALEWRFKGLTSVCLSGHGVILVHLERFSLPLDECLVKKRKQGARLVVQSLLRILKL